MKKTKSETRALTPLKKRIFLAITIFFPVVFLFCLELALRWFDYGPDLSIFKLQEVR